MRQRICSVNFINSIFTLRKLLPIILFVVVPYTAVSQKIIEKLWEAKHINDLEIVSDDIFNINIESSNTSEILVRAKIEGENYENVVLELSERKKALLISTGYTPYFEAKNDKLAAHKVISIEIEITLPANKNVFINSNLASVEMKGSFNSIAIYLNEGHCTLLNFSGKGSIDTKEGDITVSTTEGVFAQAKSKKGNVKNQLPKQGNYLLEATSINGDILLQENL